MKGGRSLQLLRPGGEQSVTAHCFGLREAAGGGLAPSALRLNQRPVFQFLKWYMTAVTFPLAWILETPGWWMLWEREWKEGTDGWLTSTPPVEHDLVPCSQFPRDVTKEWRESGVRVGGLVAPGCLNHDQNIFSPSSKGPCSIVSGPFCLHLFKTKIKFLSSLLLSHVVSVNKCAISQVRIDHHHPTPAAPPPLTASHPREG